MAALGGALLRVDSIGLLPPFCHAQGLDDFKLSGNKISAYGSYPFHEVLMNAALQNDSSALTSISLPGLRICKQFTYRV